MDFSKRTAGQKSPARSAKWCNGVSDAAAYYHQQLAGGATLGQRNGLKSPPVKVRNLTGADRRRGEVVQLGEALLTSFDWRKPWFEGNTFDASVARRIAILSHPVTDGKLCDVAVSGVCLARVQVASTSDRFAEAADGEHLLRSAASGSIEILSPLTTTGEQEVFVVIGAGGGSTTIYGQLIVDVPASSVVEDAIELESLDRTTGTFGFVYEPDEEGHPTSTKIKAAALNVSLYSLVQGSIAGTPIRVWGERTTLTKFVDEEEVSYECMILHGPYVEVIAMDGAEVEPANGVGQVPMHKFSEKKSVADGGPCGNS